ncbi:urea ABC transporter ATP-binding subunit UrtE [Porticoccaceae bacterium]|jgi:urea transport system ATP-binding protein|nr:urea ABC transporter ATP-binding subunit UrtE [Porticoccaceae bacterium]MDB9804729.1 urea ABC transporter ATP-binding subunit UrtE [Porticoccaceae bacterium]MDB9948839.1 urea ABC transporter ATP-binding subunit UrtE [Porticoccaceae bacterium]
MLKLKDYNVAYGQSRVINDMNLEIGEGEIVALVGRNGMGKTTLLKSLIGMVPHQSGSIMLGGQEIGPMESHQRVASGIGFVPQGRMIFSTMTVTENIITGLTTTGEKKIPEDLYDLFPVLKEMGKRRGGNLSGGQQQQLAIARALASRPKLLILDEPTEGIQPSIIREMVHTLRRIRDERGLSILVSEQVLSFALDVSDRVMVIEKGDIVHQESSATADQKKIAAYLSV